MQKRRNPAVNRKPMTLRTLARHVGLAPCSISAVLNDSPAAQRIPQKTKNRVLRAASRLNYQPNFSARALRTRRTGLVAFITADLAAAGIGPLVSAIELELQRNGYLLIVRSETHMSDMELSATMLTVGIEGMIAIGVKNDSPQAVPTELLSSPENLDPEQAMQLGSQAARRLVQEMKRHQGSLS